MLVASRSHFSSITVVHQAAEGEPKGSSVESSPRLPRFDVRPRRCTVGQIKRQNSNSPTSTLLFYSTPRGAAAQRGPWPPHSLGFLIIHNDTPQSVGLFWLSDQLFAENST